MVSLIFSIILGVVVAGATMTIDSMLHEKVNWVRMVSWGIVMCLINYFTPKTSGIGWLLVVFLAGIIGLDILLILDWREEGSNAYEMIPFLILAELFAMEAELVAIAMGSYLITNEFFASVVKVAPLIMLIVTVGMFVYDLIIFWSEEAEERGEEDEE